MKTDEILIEFFNNDIKENKYITFNLEPLKRINAINDNKEQDYFKYRDDKWSKIDRFLINYDRIEFFIPNLSYLACSDKNLTICNYSKVISDYKNPTKAILTDVVQNDCYIGTMGCNFYQKGLVLNQVFCSVIKK